MRLSKFTLAGLLLTTLFIVTFVAFFEAFSPYLPCNPEAVCSPSLTATYIDPPLRGYSFPQIGSGQGVQLVGDHLYIYGQVAERDEGGVVLELDKSLKPTGWKGNLTSNGRHVIPHPTGIAYRDGYPTFIGGAGDFYLIDWPLFKRDKNLDRAHLRTIRGDHKALSSTERAQGKTSWAARPEYVELDEKWLLASVGRYAYPDNYLTLMDPVKMSESGTVSDPGVIIQRIKTSPCVQTLHWHKEKQELVLVQNQFEIRGWQLSFVDLPKAITSGSTTEAVTSGFVVARRKFPAFGPLRSELEGYVALPDGREVFVAAETTNNVLIGDYVTEPQSYGLLRKLSPSVPRLYLTHLRYCLL